MRPELIVVGSSLGGLRTLGVLLAALPADFPLPVVLVQHFSRGADAQLGAALRQHTSLPLATAEDKMPISPGHIYVAPTDYHLLVEQGQFALSVDPPVRYSRPSIDVLFETAAFVYGLRLIGVVLTGANSDGTAGALAIRRRGGLVLVQDPAEAEARAMPAAAIAAGAADRVLPMAALVPALVALCAGEKVDYGQRG